MSGQLDLSTKTIKIYKSAFDATARANILAHLADLDNPHDVSKADVGLGNADNTSDASKPISTLTAAALALKASLASPALTGVPTAPTAAPGTANTQVATTAYADQAANVADAAAAAVAAALSTHSANVSNPHTVTKTQVGLGNADNTSDVNKPVSSAQQIALNLKSNIASPTFTGVPAAPTAAAGTNTTQVATTAFAKGEADAVAADLVTHEADAANPHAVTALQVGLGAVNNTSDANKPVSIAQQAALDLKANLASPTLTGVPTAPTAAPGTDTTQVATTAFAAAGLALKANLASPALTGTPTVPTAAPGTNTTQAASTAFSAAAVAIVQADATQALADAFPVASLFNQLHDRPGDGVRLYGESTTGVPSAATMIDPDWITVTDAGLVVRVDAAEADDPQVVAPAAAFALEPGRFYDVRWKVQRQTDPIDPLNDSVTLAIRWLDEDKEGMQDPTGIATIEDIPLEVADGLQERVVRIALETAPAGYEVDHAAPAGTVYFRPYVELYGDSHITDVIVISVVPQPLRQDVYNLKNFLVEGDGAADTAHIAGAFARWAATYPSVGVDIPATARAMHIPGGIYTSTQTTFELFGAGRSIYGDGPISQLSNITLRTDSQNQLIHDLRLIDDPVETNTGIEIGHLTATISRVNVFRKLIGIHADASLGGIGGGLITDCIIDRCPTGFYINGNDTRLVNNRVVSHTTAGVHFVDGGGVALIGNWVQGDGPSLLVEGAGGASIPIESYFYNNTFTNDLSIHYREWDIASIVSSDGGDTITVTFDASHELSPGVGFVTITGTGVPEYDDFRTWVPEGGVLSPTSVKLGRNWVSNVTNAGTVRAGGFDVDIQSLGGGNGFVRNFRFIGNNINFLRLNGGANLSFLDRLKTQIWLEGTGLQNPNNILIFRFPDGEFAGGAEGDDAPSNTIRNGDIRPSGPGALLGYGEIGMLRTGISGYNALLGSLKMGVWVPFTEGGFVNNGNGNTPLYYNGFETINSVNRISSNGVDHNIQATGWGVRDSRSWDITSIVTASAGASILVTLRTNVRATPGINFVRLSATGVSGYNGTWAVEAAPAANQVQLAVAYVADVGAVGTMFPEGRQIQFREGPVLSNGLPGSPTGLDFTQHISAFRGVNDDTVFGNAILRFNAPISSTPAGETRTGGFIMVPGNSAGTGRSIFIGAPTGNPNLTGDAFSIRALVSPSFEISNDGSFTFWAAGHADALARFSGIAGQDSFINLNQTTGTIFRIGNNNGGAAAWSGFEARNAFATATSTLRVGVNGTGFTTSGARIQDAGMVLTDTDLSGGLVIGSLATAANVLVYAGGALALTFGGSTQNALFANTMQLPTKTFAQVNAQIGVGKIARITDGSVNTWNATVAGGGVNSVLIWSPDGVVWKVIGAA
jgi:hypothetical protein